MYFLAQRHGIPTPEASFPQSREDVLRFIEAARFPVLLKAIHGRLSGRKPMWLVHSRKELLGNYDALEYPSRHNLMLQEYIPGPDNATWTFNGYFDGSGECRVAFTGTKLRNYPAYFGQASLGICVHNPEVAAMTICFMKAIRYKGPLDLGYRYDARDGRYKVNDINPRIGAMFRRGFRMRVTRAKIYLVEIGTLHPVIVELATDEGITGVGEAGMAYGLGGTAAAGMIKDLSEALILGQDPFRVEALWTRCTTTPSG